MHGKKGKPNNQACVEYKINDLVNIVGNQELLQSVSVNQRRLACSFFKYSFYSQIKIKNVFQVIITENLKQTIRYQPTLCSPKKINWEYISTNARKANQISWCMTRKKSKITCSFFIFVYNQINIRTVFLRNNLMLHIELSMVLTSAQKSERNLEVDSWKSKVILFILCTFQPISCNVGDITEQKADTNFCSFSRFVNHIWMVSYHY